jgi:hypothetical protein
MAEIQQIPVEKAISTLKAPQGHTTRFDFQTFPAILSPQEPEAEYE